MKKGKKKRPLSKKYIFGVKAIADYMNVSERSIYIWEQELDFPLHRVAESSKRTVYASIDEIEKWLKNKPVSGAKKTGKSKIIFGISVLAAAAVVFVLVWFFLFKKSSELDLYISPLPNPKTAFIQDKNVYIKDGRGEVIWSYIASDVSLEEDISQEYRNLDFYDIDQDQANEVIAKEYDYENNRFYLTLFDNDGSRIWQRSVVNDQSFRGLLLRSNFFPIRSKFARIQKKSFIVTAWRHRTRFLVIIAKYDLQGDLLNEYIQTGHISFLRPLDLNQDGADEILFGATHNLLNGEPVLGLLDLRDFKGVCPPNRIEPEYQQRRYLLQKYIADEVEVGNQLAYLRFKKTDYFLKYVKTYIFPIFDYSDKNIFHIYISPWDFEQKGSDIRIEYVFNSQLILLDIIPNPSLRELHPKLCQECQQDISLQELTQIYAENVYAWQEDRWVSLDEVDLDLDY